MSISALTISATQLTTPSGMAAQHTVDSDGAVPDDFVSLVVPIRNEVDFIDACIASILRSDWPADRMELLILDGMSDDGTAERVQELAAQDPRIRLIRNPQRSVPWAMNMAIEKMRGSILIRVDGHATVDTYFVRNSVRELHRRPECWCVGGAIDSVNETFVGRVIAAAMSCPVGVGNARFRTGGYEGYVDTVAFGAYRREVFARIGNFDTDLLRNQDDELNARLTEAGGKIWLSPSIRSSYFPRTNLHRLWKQYFQYGFWRIRTLQKRGRPASLRQVIPLVFVTVACLLTIAALLIPALRSVWLISAATYFCGLATGAVMVARRLGWRSVLLSPLVFVILHFGYGFGGVWGIYWFVLRGKTRCEQSMSG